MRVWYFSEMAYHPAWEEGLKRGSLRVVLPNACKFRSFRQAISVRTGRRFRWKPTGHFGPKRHPVARGFGAGFGEPPLRDTT
jgi:hypothetical protein